MQRLLIIMMTLTLAACASSPSPAPPPPEPAPEPATVPAAESVTEPQSTPGDQRAEPLPEREPEPAAPARPQPPAEPARPSPASEPQSTIEPRQDSAEPEAPAPTLEETMPAPATPTQPEATEPASAQPAAISTTTLTGQVRVERNGREQPFGARHLNETVIAWRPAAGTAAEVMPEQQMVTRQSRFFPQTMVVTSGTQVRFPNMDTIQHNVFSLTPGHRFDVGLFGQGDGRAHRFDGTGMVELFCNVHPNMAAFMLVVDTPYFTSPNDDGFFLLDGIPAGPGELLVWNYRAEEIFQRQDTYLDRSNTPLSLTVNITRPAVPQHTNKHGESYSRGRSR